MKKKLLIFVFALSLLSLQSMVAQVMLREISLKQQIENSTLVVEGKVLSKKSFWYNNLIYTSNTIEVYKVFKGQPIKTIDVITVGGAVDDKVLLVSSSLKLQKGNTGVFMLQKSSVNDQSANKSSNQFKPYGAVQGFYKYNLYDDVATNPFNSKKGISNTLYNQIINLTNQPIIEITKFDVSSFASKTNQNNKSQSPTAITFSPTTITAGTKSTITITIPGGGTGNFGIVKGKVSFSDADLGGNGNYIDALDSQVTWSSTSITVEVPSGAGTGKIRVINSDNSSRESTTDLTVTYSEINYEFDPGTGLQAYPIRHYSQSGGGYTWEMQTDFFNNTEHSGAKAAFERAMETWRCYTKINWTIANSATNIDVVANDGVNIIRFDNGGELDNTNLGSCYTWAGRYTGCTSGAPVQYYVQELDIVFDDGTTTTTPWYFGTGDPGFNYDFESVALHELGHGRQLGHVINTNAVMHFNLGIGDFSRVLSNGDIAAGNDIQSRSNSTFVCGTLSPMIDYAGSCSLSVDDENLKDAVKIYPNPSNGQFYISNDLSINLTKAVIYDISGRLISRFDISGNSKTKTINLIGASKGIYFVTIHSDNGFVTKKIVLE